MPVKRVSFANFNRRLSPIGGREQGGPAGLRIAQGVNPLITTSVMSRWGSSAPSSYSNIKAIQYFSTPILTAGVVTDTMLWLYDGAALWYGSVNGSVAHFARTGFNGTRISFLTAPPQSGSPDYLFVCGGGTTPFKVNLTNLRPSFPVANTVSNWGIVAPVNAATAVNLPQDQIVIDTFDASSANWAHTNCAVSDNSTEFVTGTGSLNINSHAATSGPWRIINSSVATLNLGTYSNGDISLETDVIQFWVFFNDPDVKLIATWIQLDFDVDDGSFKKNYYTYGIGFTSATATNPNVQHNVNTTIAFQSNQWQQITIAKSQFLRQGEELQLDWTNVQAIRFSGQIDTIGAAQATLLDNLTLSGGSALGAGPAVGNGGSEYDYYTVYRNLTTGSVSNPSAEALKIFAVQDNQIQISNIPLSTDPQVNARDLYRSQAGGGLAFYLDTIFDNVTTTYTDNTSDTSVREAVTPWQQSVAVPPNAAAPYYIDAGNGYYFILITGGTTGAQPPAWVLPTDVWAPLAAFELGATVAPITANGQFWEVTTAGVTGAVQPPWATEPAFGSTLQDGLQATGVVWTNQGTKQTNDNGVIWQLAGINSTRTLSNQEVLLDNAPPLASYADAVGPFQGSVFWTRDLANPAFVYASPPGRPESVAQFYQMTSTSDSTQKLIIWDGALWLFSIYHAFQITGSYPEYSASVVNDAIGTNYPFTIVPVQQTGIIYWAGDGVRLLNWAGSRLFGFDQLSQIFRGQPQENLPGWTGISHINAPFAAGNSGPLWAALGRDEIIFSDGTFTGGVQTGTLTIALAYDGTDGAGLTWRQLNPIMSAAYYDAITGAIYASWGGQTYYYEQPGFYADGAAGIPFQIQTMGDFPDPGQEFTVQRIYLTLNTNVAPGGTPQQITPVLIVDGVSYTLPVAQANGRQTIEYDGPKAVGRFLDGFNLSGTLATARVEIFRVEADIWLGE